MDMASANQMASSLLRLKKDLEGHVKKNVSKPSTGNDAPNTQRLVLLHRKTLALKES